MKEFTEYEKGFLDALERVVYMGEQLWDYHFKNAQNESFDVKDQEAALSCTFVVGSFCSDIKSLAASVSRGQVSCPILVQDRHWWSSPDGTGKN